MDRSKYLTPTILATSRWLKRLAWMRARARVLVRKGSMVEGCGGCGWCGREGSLNREEKVEKKVGGGATQTSQEKRMESEHKMEDRGAKNRYHKVEHV